MKYLFIFVLTFLVIGSAIAMTLSKYEFDNIGVIDTEIKSKYKNFQGFNGNKEEMDTIGLEGETVRKEIDKMDISDLVENTPEKKKERQLVKKLKQSGYDETDIKAWGLDPDNDKE